jgi:hypothetical protein
MISWSTRDAVEMTRRLRVSSGCYVRILLEQSDPYVIRFFRGLKEQLNKAGLGKDQFQSVGLKTKLNTKFP